MALLRGEGLGLISVLKHDILQDVNIAAFVKQYHDLVLFIFGIK